MYYDISLLPNNSIELVHLVRSLEESAYCGVADAPITLGEQFSTLKQMLPKSDRVRVYSRATLIIEQNATLHHINQVQDNGYDITVIRPLNERVFHSICVDYDNYDVISLDIGVKLPFMLKRNPVYEALRKGKFFEIYYRPLLGEEGRVIAMTNMINIIKATQGKNLIVASQADCGANHRTPYDCAALMASLGLPKNQALQTMKENVESMLKTSLHRKFFKSTVKEVSPVTAKKLNRRIKKHRETLLKLGKKQEE